ncbi:MAG: B12-binding domain-containing radical SAM protein, partial [Acidobacteriaceae bacterium]|nr:B12-binding domain-containing radical SAM protein [Acidobacteriaceae bacterium]
ESGSQRILDAMQRGVTVQQVRNATALCKQSGIQVGMFLMWGYEGEEIEDIQATVDHVKQCQPDVCFTTVSYPIKGTPYFDRLSPRLINILDWNHSTDRDFRVRGRHSRAFYTHADELLRSELSHQPDPAKTLAAREALHRTSQEVEA